MSGMEERGQCGYLDWGWCCRMDLDWKVSLIKESFARWIGERWL